MLHRHVVRHGKGIFIFALSRRCLPVFTLFLEQPRRHARSLNTNHSSSSRSEAGASMSSVNDSDACSRLSDSGEVLKATPTRSRSRTPSPERPDTNSSSNSTTTSSSSNTTTDSEAVDVRGNKKGLRRSIKELVSQFTKGTKVLWVDFKSSRQTWARKKAGEVLTFQEDRKLRQVGRDLAKALPVLTVFSLPIAGYLAPAVGFIFPKTLLPPQFWSSPQRLHFMLEDAMKQEVSLFPKLLQHLATLTSSPRPNSSPQQLQYSAEDGVGAVGQDHRQTLPALVVPSGRRWFWREGNLDKLTRAHLLRLIKACNTVPPFKKATASFAPTSSLVSWLRNEAASISNDDLALRKDFYSNRRVRGSRHWEGTKAKLTAAEVLVLCWERGLLRSQQWPDAKSRRKAMGGGSGGAAAVVDEPIPEAAAKAMLRSLEEYLSLYDTPSAYDPPRKAGNLRVHSSASSGHDEDGSVDNSDDVFSSRGTGAILPPSMLLHAPALLRITQSARGSASPLCHLRVEKTAR